MVIFPPASMENAMARSEFGSILNVMFALDPVTKKRFLFCSLFQENMNILIPSSLSVATTRPRS